MQSFSRFNVVWKFNEKIRGTKNLIFFKLMWNRRKLCMYNESAPLITRRTYPGKHQNTSPSFQYTWRILLMINFWHNLHILINKRVRGTVYHVEGCWASLGLGRDRTGASHPALSLTNESVTNRVRFCIDYWQNSWSITWNRVSKNNDEFPHNFVPNSAIYLFFWN